LVLSRIIDGIYVCDDKYTIDDLKKNHICYVVNVGGSKTEKEDYSFHLKDGPNPIKHYNLILKRVKEERNKGKNVLIHCREGKSRSPFLVALYLSKLEKMTLLSAIDQVGLRHKPTDINKELLEAYMKDVGLYYI
jgi:hypothetical protein